MSLLDLMKTKTDIARWGGRHPIMSFENADRNSRDAYYYGLVLGTIVDDKKVDQSERTLLNKVGYALGYSKFSVSEIVAGVLSFNEPERFSLLEEVTNVLRGSGLEKYFVAEFSFIWLSHGGDEDKLAEWRNQLEIPLACSFAPKLFVAFDRLVGGGAEDLSEILLLVDSFSIEFLEYLFVDKYPQGLSRFIEESRQKEDRLKRESDAENARLLAEADSEKQRMAEAFYAGARELVVKGSFCGRSDVEAFGTVLIQTEDLERVKLQLCDYARLDLSAAIEVIACKHIGQIATILKNATSTPGRFGGSISGMRRFRIKSERERLARIIACLAALSGSVNLRSRSALNNLLTSAAVGAENVVVIKDERRFWNEHVKPALRRIFKRKD